MLIGRFGMSALLTAAAICAVAWFDFALQVKCIRPIHPERGASGFGLRESKAGLTPSGPSKQVQPTCSGAFLAQLRKEGKRTTPGRGLIDRRCRESIARRVASGKSTVRIYFTGVKGSYPG